MSEPIIRVENLGKMYSLGHQNTEGYTALRDVLTQQAKRLFRRNDRKARSSAAREDFWALRDVSFEVRQGEVLGIIGRNGAGKSTLLKILSRITEPTQGRVRIKGRVASLLEVGTGFHPELTGRENISLNGAILGMSRAEIRAKFDEIVAFAGVEKFLDTPVKRYSSGMYVRLAFAVAAHLEPEILVIDEVLAVGDIAFQAKCLGKMGEVAKGTGRTILFVSHNMSAIMAICNRAVYLEKGRTVADSKPEEIIQRYLHLGVQQKLVVDLSTKERKWDRRQKALLAGARLLRREESEAWKVPYGMSIELQIEVEVLDALNSLELGFAVSTMTGFEIASSSSSHSLEARRLAPGKYSFRAKFVSLALVPGIYRFGLGLNSERGLEDYVPEAFEVEVIISDLAAEHRVTALRGVVVPQVEYELSTAD